MYKIKLDKPFTHLYVMDGVNILCNSFNGAGLRGLNIVANTLMHWLLLNSAHIGVGFFFSQLRGCSEARGWEGDMLSNKSSGKGEGRENHCDCNISLLFKKKQKTKKHTTIMHAETLLSRSRRDIYLPVGSSA